MIKVLGPIFGLFLATCLATASVQFFGVESAQAKRGDKIHRMAEELGLTDEQKEKLAKIHADFKQNLPGKREAMKTARNELQSALKGDATDDEVRKKFQTLQEQEAEFAKARFEKVLAVRHLLTPEQRQKFKGMDPHHFGKRGKGHFKGRNKSGPQD